MNWYYPIVIAALCVLFVWAFAPSRGSLAGYLEDTVPVVTLVLVTLWLFWLYFTPMYVSLPSVPHTA
jgi:hypothetical protein